jgi:hypothetical protein
LFVNYGRKRFIESVPAVKIQGRRLTAKKSLNSIKIFSQIHFHFLHFSEKKHFWGRAMKSFAACTYVHMYTRMYIPTVSRRGSWITVWPDVFFCKIAQKFVGFNIYCEKVLLILGYLCNFKNYYGDKKWRKLDQSGHNAAVSFMHRCIVTDSLLPNLGSINLSQGNYSEWLEVHANIVNWRVPSRCWKNALFFLCFIFFVLYLFIFLCFIFFFILPHWKLSCSRHFWQSSWAP